MGSASDKYDIVIVGLGPVGAVAANLAGAAGFRTLVVERSNQPYLLPRAIVFDAEIMRIFDAIGLAEPITAATRPLGGSIYLGADHRPIRTFRARPPAHDKAWFPSNLFFQPQLEAIIRDGLARHPNVTVLLAQEVTDLRQADGGVTLGLNGVDGGAPRTVDATFVLACDGASSTVRKALGVALDDIGFEERWLVVDTFVEGEMRWPQGYEIPQEVRDNRYSLMVCDPARPSTLIPGVGRHRRWEYMLMPGEHPGDIVPEAWLRDQLALWVDPDQVEIVRSAVYRFRALVAQRWRTGRVFLVGDAAHQTPPFYGQGMCHGLRDAAQLIWRLRLVRDGLAADSLLDSYQIEREPHVREIITASVAAGAAVCKTDPAQAAARDAEFRAIEHERAQRPVAMSDIVPPLRAGVIDPATGGDRLPELAIHDPDGDTVRLDAMIDGRFLVLGLEETTPISPLDMRVIVVKPSDAVGAWLGARGATFAIIRPDRYVHSVAADAQELSERLALLHAQLGLAAIDFSRSSEMSSL
ncbi:MAG: hypothetical protein JWP92_2527 [Caulobacter sp.]|nr:hypothetical protein [Caulobacter sp.]